MRFSHVVGYQGHHSFLVSALAFDDLRFDERPYCLAAWERGEDNELGPINFKVSPHPLTYQKAVDFSSGILCQSKLTFT